MAVIGAVPQRLEVVVTVSLVQATHHPERIGQDINYICQFN
jgi:hypothetical protein